MMRKEKAARPMGFALILIGLLFFANPYFAVIDFLPDCIGCALVYIGLSRVARISKQMSEARTAFLKLCGYFAAKDVVAIAVFMLAGGAERPTALLIVAFVNAVCAALLSYRAVYALFDGFYVTAITRSCAPLYQNYRRRTLFGKLIEKIRAKRATARDEDYATAPLKERSRTEQALRATVIFIIAREVLCVLPELSSLTTSHYMDSGLIDIYDYIGIMRLMCMFLAIVCAVRWLVVILRYFALLSVQREFRVSLAEEYREYADAHPNMGVERRFGIGFLLLGIGAFLLCDFVVDMKNVFPDYLAILFFFAAFFVMKLGARARAVGIALTSLFGVSAIVSAHYATYFHVNHTALEIAKTVAAKKAYFNMWITAFAEFLLFLVFLVAVLLILRNVTRKWAGYTPVRADLEFEKRRRARFLEEFDGELLRVYIFGFVSGLFSFLTDYVQEIPNHRIFRILEFMWGFDLVFGVVFAVMLSLALSNIYRNIQYRFSFDA